MSATAGATAPSLPGYRSAVVLPAASLIALPGHLDDFSQRRQHLAVSPEAVSWSMDF
jgi:hypothetical protein